MAAVSTRRVVEIALPDVEEMRVLVAEGAERGALTYDEIVEALQDVDVTKAQVEDFYSHLVEIGVEVLDADGEVIARDAATAPGRAPELDLAVESSARQPEALSARDRTSATPDGEPGGRARQAHRARRPLGEDGDGRGQPAPGRQHRQGLSRPRPLLPRPHPGGQPRPDPRGGEVRLPARVQVLDLRDLVDPPGGHPGDRRQGPDHPHPGSHGREAQQGGAPRAADGAATRTRAPARGDRRGAADERGRGARHPADGADAGRASRSRSARRATRSSATSSRTSRRPSPFDEASVNLRHNDIQRALEALPERERKVIELRFGLQGEQPRTLEEVGRAFGVTRERIRQIENNTLKKLQALPEAQALRDSA